MSRMDYFRQGGTPFDVFLYAELGLDSSGKMVSVLSALARLGCDPWDEAAKLSDLPNEKAESRLRAHLVRLQDIPEQSRAPGASISGLIALLPSRSDHNAGAAKRVLLGTRRPGIASVIAVLVIIVFLAQTFILGSDGSGN